MDICPVKFISNYFQNMMLAQKFDTWTQVHEFDRTTSILNEKMSEILSMTKSGLSSPECVEELRRNPGSAALVIDHFQEVVLLHNITVLAPIFGSPP